MVKLEDAVLARLDKNGHHFEIWVDPRLAWDYKHGKKEINFNDMFAMDSVYSDAKKGKEASQEILKEQFGTDYFEDVAKKIIVDGEVQLTTSQKNEMLERRRKEIIDYIAKNAHDPKAATPIPPQRIINALDQIKYKFNLSRRKEDEINEVILQLQKAIPISLEKINISFEVPAKFVGKTQGMIHKYEIVEEKWLPSGALFATLNVSAGVKASIINELNNITHGEIIIKTKE
jgi:ribosome maturation protein SDO1